MLLIRPREPAETTEFSLGLGYVARKLLHAGIKVETLCRDLYAEPDAAFYERVRTSRHDIFGIGGMYGSFPDFIRLSHIIRRAKPDAVIVLGGALPTSQPEHTLRKTGADVACLGPSDTTVVDLVLTLVAGGDISGVAGLCIRDGNTFVRTAARLQPRTLLTGPEHWPAWELFDAEAYVRGTAYYPFTPEDRVAPIVTARGCPYACNFCFQPMAYVKRQLADVFDEMEWLIDRYGITGFYLEDDLFMLDRRHVLAFCDGLHDRGIRTSFTVTGRFNIVNAELVRALKAAGCNTVFYGGEAAEQQVLDSMHKKITVEQMYQGVVMTREAGIFTRIGFMFGQPVDTRETLASTVRFLESIAYGDFEPRFIYGCVPFPDTELFKYCRDQGLLADEDDLFRRFEFKPRILDQIPVNMTSISDVPVKSLLDDANRELAAYYEHVDPVRMRMMERETVLSAPHAG